MSGPIDRREFLLGTAAAGLAACGGPTAKNEGAPTEHVPRPRRTMTRESTTATPALFVSHGAPSLALDPVKGADLRRTASEVGRPSAVLVVSAHWENTPPTVGASSRALPLIHDYGGFAPALRTITYPAPAAPDLATDLHRLVPELADDDRRGWDHGVWVPLLHMFPDADVPVLQLSLPTRWSADALFSFGRRLAPLRDDGVLILGSGGMVHNLGALDGSDQSPPPTWAVDFEAYVRDALTRTDTDALLAFRERAPATRRAHPTEEHFLPLLVAAGAAAGEVASFPITGFEYGSLSRTAVRWG